MTPEYTAKVLTDASTVTMYAVCYYDAILNKTMWWNFDTDTWGEHITHTAYEYHAYTAKQMAHDAYMIVVDIPATNARFI